MRPALAVVGLGAAALMTGQMASAQTIGQRASARAAASSAPLNVGLQVVSHDPYTNTTSYHQTELEPDTYTNGSTIVSAFQSGRFSDGGASNIGWATSSDGGKTWTHGFLPATTVFATPAGPWARISDPTVAYDPKAGLWMISGLALDSGANGKAVLVSTSSNGTTWSNPVTVSQGGSSDFYDKDWVTCDTWSSSPYYGNCYAEWDNYFNGNQLMMSRSTDGGQTWQASSVPFSSVIGGQPVVQPDGNVVMPIDDAFEGNVESFVSTDGGQTYAGPYTVSSIDSHGEAGNLRSGPLPSAAVDGAGNVYVVWQDCRFRPNCSANDIVMSTSSDGINWTAPVRIPAVATSSPVDLFIPGIAVDRSTSGAGAHIGIATYGYTNTNCSPSTCQLILGYISSTNGGSSWSFKTKVFGPIGVTWLAPTNQGYMVGDYIGAGFSGGSVFPVVADAIAGSCVLGQNTSCHEAMVAPTTGLPAATGAARVVDRRQRVLSPYTQIPHTAKTAF